MQRTVNLTLIEDSFGPAGRHHEQSFVSQKVDVTGGGRITQRSAIGDTEAHGYLPWGVIWRGGTAHQLRGVTEVRMIDSKTGSVVVEGPFNYNSVPTDILGGVEFQVLQPE
jgi:hypothetical protein